MAVPDKIYIEMTPNGGYYWDVVKEVKSNDSDIEYIRTDAFIEKATEWFSEIENGTTITDIDKFVEDFKKAMNL